MRALKCLTHTELRSLTLPLPTRGGHAEVLARRWESISGEQTQCQTYRSLCSRH